MLLIYSLEDDNEINYIIGRALTNAGFSIKSFIDYRLFFDAIKKTKPDLILLDLSLPMIDGVEILKYLKSQDRSKRIPIIVVSARTLETDKTDCLDSGADDYLVKPFGIRELISRINAVLRRVYPSRSDNVCLSIDYANRTVEKNGSLIQLTCKEYELLVYLTSHVNKVISRSELMNKIWHEVDTHSRTLDMHINSLRKKVFNDINTKIITITKVGYKLVYE